MAIEIRLETLEDGPKSGEVTLDAGLVASQGPDGVYMPSAVPLTLSWTLTRTAGVVQLDATVSGQLDYGCARCTNALTLPIEVDVSHHWVPPGDLEVDGAPEDGEFDRDPDVSEHDGETIDLAPVVMECLLVELPYAPDCEPSVQGRCPEWTDEARVLHPGGEAPEVVPESPFAALAGLQLPKGPDAEA